MAAARAMLDRLAGIGAPPPDPVCQMLDANNLVHWQAGRARVCDIWFLCAVGSGEVIGVGLSNARLYGNPTGNFSTTGTPDRLSP